MNKMPKSVFYLLTTIILLGFLNTVAAVDFEFSPRLETGFIYYSFKQNDFSNTTTSTDGQGNVLQQTITATTEEYKDTLPFVGLGVTLFADRFFLDLSAQKAFNGSDNDWNQKSSNVTTQLPDNGEPTITSFFSRDSSWDYDFDRTEYTASLGYAITERLAIFAGYKKTKMEVDSSDPNRHVSTLQDGTLVDEELSLKFSSELEHEGPFLGAVYGWNVNKGFLNGSLSANVAIAFLDGISRRELLSGQNLTTGAILSSNTLPENNGNTTGVTFGLKWNGLTPVEKLTYSVGISGHDYSFDGGGGGRVSFDETVVTFRVGIAYSF